MKKFFVKEENYSLNILAKAVTHFAAVIKRSTSLSLDNDSDINSSFDGVVMLETKQLTCQQTQIHL